MSYEVSRSDSGGLIWVQNLSTFRNPPNSRGRSAFIVQLWWIVQATLFRGSPQFMYGWRRWLLRRFGARIGRSVLVRSTARVVYPWMLQIGDHSWIGDQVELYSLGEINIGSNVVVSQQSYLCTGSHDYRVSSFDLIVKSIKIGNQAWIAAGVFVHPGVSVAEGCVVGARSVVSEDTEAYCVYSGYPAKKVGARLQHMWACDDG
jgi:putative colanic acid biosynthesis acetyltransferase WcaF